MTEHNSPNRILIYDAWYMSEVITEIMELNDRIVVGYVDPQPPENQQTLNYFPENSDVLLAIGDNSIREYIARNLTTNSRTPESAIHPTAILSNSASIGDYAFLGEYSIVRTSATIGDGLLLQSGAVISHHCKVGKFVSIGPNAAIASKVSVGDRTLIGVGASVKPGIEIGNDCIIGAGAVVVSDLPPHSVVGGNPARQLRKSTHHKREKKSDWSINTVW